MIFISDLFYLLFTFKNTYNSVSSKKCYSEYSNITFFVLMLFYKFLQTNQCCIQTNFIFMLILRVKGLDKKNFFVYFFYGIINSTSKLKKLKNMLVNC